MKQNNKTEENQWTTKNIFIAVVLVAILLGTIQYSVESSQKEIQAKKTRLNNMTLQGVAGYIMEKKSGVIHIDAITKVYPISLNGNVLEFPYQVKDGFLRRFATVLQSTEHIKNTLQTDTLNEDCRKTAFSVFLQKGGVIHYTYHLQKDNKTEFLFDFNNTWALCQTR